MPEDGGQNYKKALMRPFLDDFLLSLMESFEVIMYSDMTEKRTSYLVKQIESQIDKKAFSYILHKEQCVKNTKTGQYIPDLSILLNKRLLSKIAYVDCNIDKFALIPSNSIFVNKFEYTPSKRSNDRSLIELKSFLNHMIEMDNFQDVIKASFIDSSEMSVD